MRFTAILSTLAALLAAGAAAAQLAAMQPPADAIPDVSGTWRTQAVRLVGSSCPAALTDVVRERIERGAMRCTLVVAQAGASALVTHICPDETVVFSARVDRRGELRGGQRTPVNDGNCRWLFTNTLSAALGSDPATLTALYLFEFEPACNVADCAIDVAGELERIALAGIADAGGPATACRRRAAGLAPE